MAEKKPSNNVNYPNGYKSVEINEVPDKNEISDWNDIEKRYYENKSKNNVLDWEGFKKEYYKLEHQIKESLDELHKFQIDFSKKITYIEYLNTFLTLLL